MGGEVSAGARAGYCKVAACIRSEKYESGEMHEWRQCAFPLAFGAPISDQAIEEDVLALCTCIRWAQLGAGNQCTSNTLRRAGPAAVLCLLEGRPWEGYLPQIA